VPALGNRPLWPRYMLSKIVAALGDLRCPARSQNPLFLIKNRCRPQWPPGTQVPPPCRHPTRVPTYFFTHHSIPGGATMLAIRTARVLTAMVGILIPLSTAALAADDDPAEMKIELKKGDKIIFLGDSLTALAVKDGRVPEGKGYVPLVREALKDKGVEVD